MKLQLKTTVVIFYSQNTKFKTQNSTVDLLLLMPHYTHWLIHTFLTYVSQH